MACVCAVGAVFVMADAAFANSSALKKLFAQGQRFIELLNAPAAGNILPTQTDLDMRFANGAVAYGAQDVLVLKDRALQGHINRVNAIMTSLLAAYTEGPKPARIPFVVVSTNDVNCAITPVAPEQYKNHLTTLAEQAFGTAPIDLKAGLTAQARTQPKTVNTPVGPLASFADDDIPATMPVLMEMRCSRLFLDQVTSDDEMAFVLAHELSHVLLGHWQAGDAQIRQQVGTEKALQTGLGLISASQSLQAGSGHSLSGADAGKYDDARTKLTAATFMLNEYNIVVRGPAWKREQERDADILALDLLHKAKRTRAGSWEILAKGAAAQAELARKNGYFDSLMKSTATRLVLGVSTNRTGVLSTIKATAWTFGSSVYGHFRDSQIQKVHDDAAARTKAVIEYESEHAEAAKPSAAEDDFFAGNSFARASAPIGRANDFVADIEQNSCQTLSPDSQKTLAAMQAARQRTQTESAALYTYYDCRDNGARALTYAAEAANGPAKVSDYYTRYILALIKAKQYARANTVIAEATRLAPPYDQYVFVDIEVKLALKQRPKAVRIAKACYASLRASNGDAARHCMDLVGLDENGDPLPVDGGDDKPKGITGMATSVADHALDRAGSLVTGAKRLINGDKDEDSGKGKKKKKAR